MTSGSLRKRATIWGAKAKPRTESSRRKPLLAFTQKAKPRRTRCQRPAP